MRQPTLRIALLALSFAFLAALWALDATVGYRSPWAGPELRDLPRQRGLRDLQDYRRKREKEEARRRELLASLTTERMVELGREIVMTKGLCLNCHSIGAVGTRTQGPNLEGVGARAATRVPGLSDLEYLSQSLYQPEAFIVPGFAPAMTPVNQPPIALDDLEILMVVAFLQSLGGKPGVTPQTQLPGASRGQP